MTFGKLSILVQLQLQDDFHIENEPESRFWKQNQQDCQVCWHTSVISAPVPSVDWATEGDHLLMKPFLIEQPLLSLLSSSANICHNHTYTSHRQTHTDM